MAHKTYTTKAIVCGAYDHNTSDKSFLLFTREAGMLYAVARSVREERSKQRPAMQEFSLIKISLVKGKQGWRIGSVEPEINFFSLADNRAARGSVVALTKVLRRFLHGEEPMSELFDLCVKILNIFTDSVEDRSFLEALAQLRILTELGYVDEKHLPGDFRSVGPESWCKYKHSLTIKTAQNLVDKAIQNSHL